MLVDNAALVLEQSKRGKDRGRWLRRSAFGSQRPRAFHNRGRANCRMLVDQVVSVLEQRKNGMARGC